MKLDGRCRSCSAVRTAATASPSEMPGATLNEMVVAGNWPRWLIESGDLCCVIVAIEDSITLPVVEVEDGR